MKASVLILTLNPAVDYLLWTDKSARPSWSVSAGGKGINVGRALKRLGVPGFQLGFSGGAMHKEFLALLKKESLPGRFIQTETPVRVNITLHASKGRTRRFLGPAVVPSQTEKIKFMRAYGVLLKKARLVLVCGSLPPGMETLLTEVMGRAKKAGVPVWVDTSGRALKTALRNRPALVKPNLRELEELSGKALPGKAARIKALRGLSRRGISFVALTLGARGAMLCKGSEIWYANAPGIREVSELGCGDAFLAGLVLSYLKKDSPPQMLSRATALGAASALTPVPGSFHLSRFSSLKSKIHVTQLI